MPSITKTPSNFTQQEWYQTLVDECKAIITEAVFNSRYALVEGYWNVGKLIKDTYKTRKDIYGKKIAQDLAESIGISERTVNYACAAYEKYPDIGTLPEGKNISWNKLITKYLPEPKREALPLPDGKYQVIYADPPWCYGDKHDFNGTTGAETYYPSMTIEELCDIKLPVADDAILFIWVTSPLLDECWPVIKAWGFEYKTSFVWDKVKHNMGHYNSVRHELLLVCTRGSFVPQNKTLFDSVITEERSDTHSQKPVKVYEIIETLYPHAKYLEMFARNKRGGWTSWGNEV